MAYEVGVGYLDLVPSLGGNFSRLLQGAGNDVQRTLGGAGERAGEEAGGLFSGSFGKVLKAGAIVGAVVAVGKVAGTAFSSTFGEAMERQASTEKLSAQLGLSEADSKQLGATAGKLYAQAYGDSFEGVTEAIGVVKSSLKNLDAGQLEAVTKKALSFSQAFDVDMSRSVQSVSTLIGSGLVKDSTEAFDILTKASQQVPAALREDVLDASDEYSQFFKALGFNGAQAFGALTKASDKGVFGIDKTGDAIKEFTIRATDMSTSTQGAFTAIGLDAQTMANDILAGGDTAQGATQKIIDGLLNIKDPATQANTAIALFGTPLEDLGVSNIPTFLSSLQGATGGLGDFAGAADAVDKKLGNTIQAKFTSLTRTLEGFGPTLSQAFLPFVGPVLDGLTSIATRGQEKLQDFSNNVTGFFAGFNGETDVELTDNQKRWATWGQKVSEEIRGPLQRAQKSLDEFWGALTTGFGGGAGPLGEIGAAIHDTVGDAFTELLNTGKQVFDTIGPPLIDAFKTIWDAVKPLVPTFLELFQAFNPVGLLFKALQPILPQIAEVVGELAKVLADGIARALKAVAPLFETVVGVINRLMPFVTKLVASLLPPFVSLIDKLAPLFEAILDALEPVVDALVDALIPAIDALMPIVERVFGFIATSIENAINLFQGIIDFITGVFTGDWEKVWTGVKEIFGAIWDQIKNIFSTLWDVITEFFTNLGPKLLDLVSGLRDKLIEWGGKFLGWIWEGIQDLWTGTLWPWFQNLPALIWSGIKAAASKMVEWGGEFLSWLWNGITSFFSDEVGPWFAALPGMAWDALVGFVGAGGSWVLERGKEFIGWIKDGIVAGAESIWNFFKELPGKAWDALIALKDKILQIGKDFVGWIVDGVKAVAGSIWDAITSALSGENSGRPEDSLTGANLPGVVPGGIARGGLVARAGGGMMDFLSAENTYGRQWVRPQGYISGPGGPVSDSIPTWLSDGEYVNRAASVAKYYPALDALNSDKPEKAMWAILPHLATGGLAGTKQRAKELGGEIAWSYANKMIDDIKNGAGQPVSGFNSSQDPSSFGWKRAAGITPFSWNGTPIVGGVAGGTQGLWTALLNSLVPQIPGGLMAPIWGFENRNNVNSPGNASFHSYGLALDINAPQNPNGAAGYGRSGQGVIPAALAHSLAAKLGLEWGGDFRGTPDPMHFEVHLSPQDAAAAGGMSALGNSISGITSSLMSKLGVAATDNGSGVERWRPLGLEVLRKVGLYVGKNLLPYINNMMLQIKTESSGDPNAANYTDINAMRGDPSIGLLQVIRSTFVSALQGTPFAYLIARGQRDPEASMTASALYGLNRYGSLDRAWRGVAYANGGITPDWGGGIDSVPAWLTPGEGVFTPPQTKAIITHAQALEAGYAGMVPNITVNVNVDGEKLDARTEIIVEKKMNDGAAQFVRSGGQY